MEIKSKNVYKQAADSECFKVMLDSMSPNHGRNEFDDIVKTNHKGQSIVRELEDEDDLDYDPLYEHTKSQNIYNRHSLSKTDSANYSITNLDSEDPPIAVSPTERNGKHHETIF